MLYRYSIIVNIYIYIYMYSINLINYFINIIIILYLEYGRKIKLYLIIFNYYKLIL